MCRVIIGWTIEEATHSAPHRSPRCPSRPGTAVVTEHSLDESKILVTLTDAQNVRAAAQVSHSQDTAQH